MTEDNTIFEGEPSCNNCDSIEIEAIFGENGQYKGSWCEDCDSMSYGDLSRRPQFYKVQSKIADELKDTWRLRISDTVYDAILEICWDEEIDEEVFSKEDIEYMSDEFVENGFEGFDGVQK